MKLPLAIFILVLSATSTETWSQDSCSKYQCQKGTPIETRAMKEAPLFLCPSRDVAQYLAMTTWSYWMYAALANKKPSISKETGEPLLDATMEGTFKKLRTDAGVGSVPEAQALCQKGNARMRGEVVDAEVDSDLVFPVTFAGKGQTPFWIPKSYAFKRGK